MSGPEFEKSVTELKLKPKQKRLRGKTTIHIAIFNVKTLNWISQVPELKVTVAEHDINIVYMHEYWYYHSEVERKYHDTGNV